ncbi:hypothetical protein OZX65_00170 [Leuconostocaceae bacterium ESL0723]|nr:hypothetical protein OZX65_00170 [Leuconostocaceae bacterium ESL0723]
MLALLDLINSYMAYFTANTKTKGRIYTVVGFVGVWYLLYLAYRFFENGRLLRSAILVAIFLVLLYFSVLNLIYYFTKKAVKWDISRNIAKVLGTSANDDLKGQTAIVPANGLYEKKDVVNAEVSLDASQADRLNALAKQLSGLGLWHHEYGRLSRAAQRQVIAEKGSIAANYPGTLLPYFDLKQVPGDHLVIMGGVNQLEAQNIATVDRVGLMPTHQAQADYRLALASVVVTGGLSKMQGRKGIVEVKQPYRLKVEMAYQKRDPA